MPGEIAVIGLGQFGQAVARSLAAQGQSVLAIDNMMDSVEAIQDDVDVAAQADATNKEALYGLRLEQMSCVIVAMGAHSMEASIVATALLSELGVPRIIARATNDLHARILRSVGASEVIDPELDMGKRLARKLSQPSIVDQIDLGDAEIAEVEAPQAFVGQTLAELALRNEYDVSVLAIRRGDEIAPNPRANATLQSGDILVVLGRPDDVTELASLA